MSSFILLLSYLRGGKGEKGGKEVDSDFDDDSGDDEDEGSAESGEDVRKSDGVIHTSAPCLIDLPTGFTTELTTGYIWPRAPRVTHTWKVLLSLSFLATLASINFINFTFRSTSQLTGMPLSWSFTSSKWHRRCTRCRPW